MKLQALFVAGVLTVVAGLISCNGLPIPPIPTPSPEAPGTPYDCANPPALTGLITVKSPVGGKYIVVLKQRPGIPARAEVQSVARAFSALKDVRAFEHALSGFAASADAKTIAAVLKDSRVQYVQEVGTKSIPPVRPGKKRVAAAVPWNLDRDDQPNLPLDGVYAPGADGSGLHGVDEDTGCDSQHNEFTGRVGECFNAGNFFGGCEDGNDHGTHTAGTILGTTWGVAKKATLHCDRVLDKNGSGTDDQVIAGVDWATKLKNDHPTWDMVANMSLGGSAAPALDQAVCNSIAAGVTYVIAAGNDSGDACLNSPARVAQAITVAASDDGDNSADFTSNGKCVSLYAPGVDVESAKRGGGSIVFSGTSMATPNVTGGAALYLQRHPGSTPAQVKAGLLAAATPGKIKGAPADTANLLLYVKE